MGRTARRKQRPACPHPTKRCYKDELTALIDNADLPTVRAYRCRCRAWHITTTRKSRLPRGV